MASQAAVEVQGLVLAVLVTADVGEVRQQDLEALQRLPGDGLPLRLAVGLGEVLPVVPEGNRTCRMIPDLCSRYQFSVSIPGLLSSLPSVAARRLARAETTRPTPPCCRARCACPPSSSRRFRRPTGPPLAANVVIGDRDINEARLLDEATRIGLVPDPHPAEGLVGSVPSGIRQPISRTARPPGRSTRNISASARDGSGKASIEPMHVTTLKRSVSHGSSAASPLTISAVPAAMRSASRCRARSIWRSERSRPAT